MCLLRAANGIHDTSFGVRLPGSEPASPLVESRRRKAKKKRNQKSWWRRMFFAT